MAKNHATYVSVVFFKILIDRKEQANTNQYNKTSTMSRMPCTPFVSFALKVMENIQNDKSKFQPVHHHNRESKQPSNLFKSVSLPGSLTAACPEQGRGMAVSSRSATHSLYLRPSEVPPKNRSISRHFHHCRAVKGRRVVYRESVPVLKPIAPITGG